MSRRVLSLVVAGLCLTVTPAVAERAPNGAATTTASHVALAAPMCAARLLPVVRPLTGAAAASCGTTAPTPTPPTPAQALCGPTVAGLNDECPDWASAPLPDVTIAAILPSFLYLAAWSALAGFAYAFIGFETKGKSIEEIDRGLTAGRQQLRGRAPVQRAAGDRRA